MCEVILAGVVQLSSRWIKRATKFHHIFDFAVYFNGFLYGYLAKRRFNFVYILVFSGRERYNVRTMLNAAVTLPTTALHTLIYITHVLCRSPYFIISTLISCCCPEIIYLQPHIYTQVLIK